MSGRFSLDLTIEEAHALAEYTDAKQAFVECSEEMRVLDQVNPDLANAIRKLSLVYN